MYVHTVIMHVHVHTCMFSVYHHKAEAIQLRFCRYHEAVEFTFMLFFHRPYVVQEREALLEAGRHDDDVDVLQHSTADQLDVVA